MEEEDVVKIISTASNTSLGQWEEHTNVCTINIVSVHIINFCFHLKGIGTKLLQKMGYVYGSGS